jgi:hypothetical protein
MAGLEITLLGGLRLRHPDRYSERKEAAEKEARRLAAEPMGREVRAKE